MKEVTKNIKKNRVAETAKNLWKYENLVLVVLALFAIELGVLILTKELTIDPNAFIIGEYWKAFSWGLVVIGTLSIIMGVASFYRSSFTEVKHITGLKKREFLTNTLTVIIFSLILAFLFVGYDALIELVINTFAK